MNAENTEFVWRGKGMLFLLKSRWKVLHFDKSGSWMIIQFRKTLFTPEGYDVISKQETLPEQEMQRVTKKLRELNIHEQLIVLDSNLNK